MQPPHGLRPPLGQRPDDDGQERVLGAQHAVGDLVGQHAAGHAGQRVRRGQRDHVARRALEHGHVRGPLGQRGDQRDRGRAAADHHHALAGVVGVVRPRLGMDDPAAEALRAGELRRVAGLVAVVARAAEQEAAGHPHGLARVRAGDLHVPARLRGGPLGRHHPVVEADRPVDPRLARRVAHVVADVGAADDRLRPVPRPEREAQRVHVRVRADAREAEQVPGAADVPARLDDGERAAGAALAQPVARGDAGDPGAHDEDVDVLGVHAGSLVPTCASSQAFRGATARQVSPTNASASRVCSAGPGASARPAITSL